MKWTDNKPRPGQLRERTAFLLWPRQIGGHSKWLEIATWVEKYVVVVKIAGLVGYYAGIWQPIQWGYIKDIKDV